MPTLPRKYTNRLTPISFSYMDKNRKAIWKYVCQCGNEKLIRMSDVKSGRISSCGCLQKKLTSDRSRTHGDKKSREYRSWRNMIERCTNPNNTSFHNYGMRGITVCERWLHSYENFLSDIGRKPTPKHTIERINNDGNYEPSNCRWATYREQAANTRRNHWIEHNGKRLILADWARELGINSQTLSSRLKSTNSLELITPDGRTIK